jgi:putative nucleotidyltransferase with HDIG domain
MQVHADIGFTFYALTGSLTAAISAGRVVERGTLVRAGLRVGLANATVVVALLLLGNHFSLAAGALGIALALANGALCGILVSGVAPVIEWLFSYTTDVKLLELANREQSLLRELELRAPGTYHHSMMVGHLAEKAAEAIGANALLAKVAGYYHDIGKMRRPQFFVENVTVTQGENRHEKLSPSMSARIIQAHVKDGVEMAEQHHLALPILRGIMEHHGTSVIRFFYEKAKEFADPEKGDLIAEHDYRYPGPKPQTREAGILMLADSVEAASRTLADTAPARVQQLVQRIINNYFRDGQLDECNLTLRDLHAIARSFIETLSAIRHERIDYPETTDAAGRRLEEVDEGSSERSDSRAGGRPEGAREKREDDLKRLGLD